MIKKQKILIVDDSEMNRALLTNILEDQYDVTEAENGIQAVEILAENKSDLWFVLLDIMMPEMNGFDVLNYINRHCWNDRVVVMMISSDDSPENINRAYSMGAFDYIGRPFDPVIVHKRIENTLLLYARQQDLEETIKEQFYEQQKSNDLMISILSHIVEFRNGESGLHIQNVKKITELLLRHLIQITDRYQITEQDISLISMASAIHDVGKISIPEEILNKPGKLTAEEFEIMKKHSEIGFKMISDLPIEQFNLPIAKVSCEICRWHHERYDGKGYPDGLKGDEIPIAAQVVSLADVYDALTSERCYKKAFSHEEAISMILGEKCGVFNPVLLQCLNEIADRLKSLSSNTDFENTKEQSKNTNSEEKNDKSSEKHETMLKQPGYMNLLYVDSLTEVYNQRYYKEHIQNFANIEAVAIIDVNHLTQINDNYGQDVGDIVLKLMANTLLSQIRRNDYVIRYGGDKFLIIFESMTKESFESRLESIRRNCESLTIDEYPQIHTSVSIEGIYDIAKPEKLFNLVDNRLNNSNLVNNQVSIYLLDENDDMVTVS